MASPQTENGYTKIANEILEKLGCFKFLGSEYAVLICVIRKTYGFHKKEDFISLTQFEKFTNLSRPTIVSVLKNLTENNVLLKENGLYIFNKDWEKWGSKASLTSKAGLTRTSKHRLTDTSKAGLTHKRKKETIKEIAKTSFALKVKNKKMKKNSFNYKETNHEDSYEDVVDLETGEKSVPKKENTKKYPNARKVFALFGNVPANWRINKTQLQSAENLFTERGIEQIIKALQFYKENKDEEYCPVINSPYDLDSKWAKLVVFKKKQ